MSAWRTATRPQSVRRAAVIRAEPDEARLRIAVSALEPSAGAAIAEVSRRSAALTALLDELGVAAPDRSTVAVVVEEDLGGDGAARRSDRRTLLVCPAGQSGSAGGGSPGSGRRAAPRRGLRERRGREGRPADRSCRARSARAGQACPRLFRRRRPDARRARRARRRRNDLREVRPRPLVASCASRPPSGGVDVGSFPPMRDMSG